MAQPASKQELKDYCLRKLGFPVIDINIDDDQVDDRIDDALQKYAEFHFDGTTAEYLKYQISATDYTNRYLTMPDSIVGVRRVFPISTDTVNSGSGSNFNIFDLNYQLRLNELYEFTSSSYTYYWIARSHIRMLELLLVGENPIRFNRKQNRLYLDMNWSANEVPTGHYVIVECQAVLDPATAPRVYGDSWLKEYATQLVKKQWGSNLTKYGNYTLPGGIVLNGETLYNDASAEILRLEEQLRDTYEEPPMFEVG